MTVREFLKELRDDLLTKANAGKIAALIVLLVGQHFWSATTAEQTAQVHSERDSTAMRHLFHQRDSILRAVNSKLDYIIRFDTVK